MAKKNDSAVLNNGFELFADIDLSDLPAEVAAAGSLVDVAAAGVKGGFNTPEYQLRTVKPTSNETLQWQIPGMEYNEVPSDVIALRGYPVGMFFNMSMYSSQDRKTACRTVALDNEGGLYHNTLGPMTNLMYSGNEYGKPNQPSQQLLRQNPIGSRGFSCADCIRAGLHEQTYVDSKNAQKTDRCGGAATLVMLVTDMVIRRVDVKTRQASLDWTRLEDYSHEGNTFFDKPVLMRVEFRASAANWKQDVQIKCAPIEPMIPSDLRSWNKFYEKIINDRLLTDVDAKGNPLGHLRINSPIEVWSVKPLDTQKDKVFTSNTIRSMVGFKLPDEDLSYNIGGKSLTYGDMKAMGNLLPTLSDSCYNVYRQEYVALGGKLSDDNTLDRPKMALLSPEAAAAALQKALPAGNGKANGNGNGNSNPFAKNGNAELPEATDIKELKSAAVEDYGAIDVDASATDGEASTAEVDIPAVLFSRNS